MENIAQVSILPSHLWRDATGTYMHRACCVVPGLARIFHRERPTDMHMPLTEDKKHHDLR